MRRTSRARTAAGSNPSGTGADRRAPRRIQPARDTGDYERRILVSLRKIVRAIDLYSRELKSICGLTVPQLVCLSAILKRPRATAVGLAVQVHLSPSTLVGILDRLEGAGHIRRERNSRDRREVMISATRSGRDAVRQAPSPLQDNLSCGLAQLSTSELVRIAGSLEKVVELMEAQEIQVAPLLTLERKSYAAPAAARAGAAGTRPRKARGG